MSSSKRRRIESIPIELSSLRQLGIMPGRVLSSLCRLPYVLRQEIIDFLGCTLNIDLDERQVDRDNRRSLLLFIGLRFLSGDFETTEKSLGVKTVCFFDEGLSEDVLSWYIRLLFGYFCEDRTRKVALIFRDFYVVSEIDVSLSEARRVCVWIPLFPLQSLQIELDCCHQTNPGREENLIVEKRRFRVACLTTWGYPNSSKGVSCVGSFAVRRQICFVFGQWRLLRELQSQLDSLHRVNKLFLEAIEDVVPGPSHILPSTLEARELVLSGVRPTGLPQSLHRLSVCGKNPSALLFDMGTWILGEIRGKVSLCYLFLHRATNVPSDVLLETLRSLPNLRKLDIDAVIPFDEWKEKGIVFPNLRFVKSFIDFKSSLEGVPRRPALQAIFEGVAVIFPYVEELNLNVPKDLDALVDSTGTLSLDPRIAQVMTTKLATLQNLDLWGDCVCSADFLDVILSSHLTGFYGNFHLMPALLETVQNCHSTDLRTVKIDLILQTLDASSLIALENLIRAFLELNLRCLSLRLWHEFEKDVNLTEDLVTAVRESSLRFFQFKRVYLKEEKWCE